MSGEFEVEACRAASLPASVEEEQPESPTCSTTGASCFGVFKTLKGDGWTVSIRQSRKGFRCNAVIDAVLPLSPDEVFDLLIDPEVKEWRQVKVIHPCTPSGTINNGAFGKIVLYTVNLGGLEPLQCTIQSMQLVCHSVPWSRRNAVSTKYSRRTL